MIDKAGQMYLAGAVTSMYLQTFAAYPPSQAPDSWSIDRMTRFYLNPE
jgi:arylsulfatase